MEGASREAASSNGPMAEPDHQQHIPRLRRISWWRRPLFSSGPGWRADCSCGWEGKTRVEKDRAVADLSGHWVQSQSATDQGNDQGGSKS